jgi:outer membrane protein assembly factor BamB
MPEKKISILDARLALADTSGVIWFFDPATGDELSKYTCDYFIHSDLSYSKSLKTLYFGSRFGIISGIDPFTMKLKFSFRAGHYVDSTPALLTHGDKKYIFAGSYDRSIYCLDAEISNRIIWRFPTDYHIFSSFQCAFFNNEPALLAPGFDRNIYLLDVKTGKKLWKYRHKELLWPYIKRGDALFSSAGVFHSRNNKEPMLIYPAFDGFLYCFQ